MAIASVAFDYHIRLLRNAFAGRMPAFVYILLQFWILSCSEFCHCEKSSMRVCQALRTCC